MKIKEWTDSEAEKYFKQIEMTKGNNESYDIELKESLCWENTPKKTNTTQRVFSGFANTYGGYLIIGFNKKGELKGVKELKDIENHIIDKLGSKLQPKKRDYISSLFKSRYYIYKDESILVIFIQQSLIPLQCDNGVYYYREQSQFKFMPHSMLEDKFRKSFEEEKNIYLAMDELEHLTSAFNSLSSETRQMRGFKIEFFLKDFLKSQDTLYYFYKRNNLLVSVEAIIKPLRFLVSAYLPFNPNHIHIIESAKSLLKSLKEISDKNNCEMLGGRG